jgi:predicted nuclease of predicted toxin-antitoxin system
MKFKLDENFGSRTQQLFQAYGHDVQTVRMQGLQGSSDMHLFEVCRVEQRCMVTLDLDFADVLRFPPSLTADRAKAVDRGTQSNSDTRIRE